MQSDAAKWKLLDFSIVKNMVSLFTGVTEIILLTYLTLS